MVLTALTSAVRNESKFNSEELENYIQQISLGDKNALSEFYIKTKVAIYGFALSILKNPYDAEDVLQNTFINVYNSAPEYTSQGKPMAWVFTIARNLSLMKIRESNKTISVTQDQWGNFQDFSQNCTSEDKIFLETIMKSLSDTQRQITILHAISGFKHREIAEILHIPLSTVLSSYNIAIKHLKILFKEE